MARTNLTVQVLAKNAGTVYSGTAIDGTNGIAVLAGSLARRAPVYFRVTNTGGTIGTVLVNPGAYPPAFTALGGTASPGGTLLVVIANASEAVFALEHAKYVQTDGNIWFDFTPTTMAGSVTCYQMPYDI